MAIWRKILGSDQDAAGYIEFGAGPDEPGHLPFHVDQTGAVTARSVTALGATDWINVTAAPYGADPTGAADSTTVIQSAANALPPTGGTLYFPAGTYALSGAITLKSGTIVQGAGMDSTILRQSSTTPDTITATDHRYLTVRDIQLSGPNSGSGRGIAFLYSAAAVANVSLSNVRVLMFGGDGVHLETVISSVLSNVRSENNGGIGFLLTNGTSCALLGCYANANTGNGFELDTMTYCTLDGCASDGGTVGYCVHDGGNIVLTGCGSETPATGFEVNAAAGVVLASCYVRAETSIAFHVTGSATGAVMISPREASPDNATASIQVDPASTLTVITPNLTTAASYATGTTNVIGDANGNIGIAQPNGLPGISIDAGSGSGGSQLRLRRGSNASFTAGMLVSTSGTDKWLVGMRNDSTNNLHIRDVADGLSALCTVPNATQPSLSLLSGTPSLGSGVGVIFIANNSSDPSGTPCGGGILYVSNGALKYKGSSGTVTTLGNA